MSALPTHISQYEIRGVLGQGGMGVVYRAFDPALRREVALKVLRTDSDDQRERFRREARIVARLQHPNIVAIYAVGEHEGQPFIAMEYIDGEPLSEGIRRRAAWGLHRKLMMGADLCAGLAFAHRAGVIHRDVKPSNLIVSNGSGTVRLLDFGIARGADVGATLNLTMHGNIVGTLNYMSPEQITGQPLDHRSDIFAVGLVLYELLAYRQAFPGDNLATLTYRIVHGTAQPLRELQPDLDDELCAVVERAMARAPEDRFPHLDALRTAVLQVATRLTPDAAALVARHVDGSQVRSPSSAPPIWSRALDPTVAATGPASTGSTALVGDLATAEAVQARRRPWLAVVGAASLLVVGATAWLVFAPTTPAPERADGPPPAATTVERPSAEVPPAEPPPSPGQDPVRPPAGQGTTTRDGSAPAQPASPENNRVPKRETLNQTAADVPSPVRPDRALGETKVVETERPGSVPETSARDMTRGVDDRRQTPSVAPPIDPVPAPAPPAPRDEDLVQQVLQRWARAYAARDARAVDDLQPGVEDALRRQFSDLSSVTVALTGCRVSVQGPRATAECDEAFTAQARIGGQRTTVNRRRQFALDKASGAWRITSARIG